MEIISESVREVMEYRNVGLQEMGENGSAEVIEIALERRNFRKVHQPHDQLSPLIDL